MSVMKAQILQVVAEKNRHRRPPWILEVSLIFPRPGIDERVRFREIDETKVKWETDHFTPDNYLFSERVQDEVILQAKLRRVKKGFWLKLIDTAKSAIGQFFSSGSPLQWYTIRDMLDAGERVSGVREKIREDHPADMQGYIFIEDEEVEKEMTIELFTLDDWKNPYPRMGDARDRDYIEIIKPEGEKAGKVTLKIRRG